jgi:hypothetical protein
MLADCSGQLREVAPRNPKAQTPLPKSLDDYQIITFDGKAIKRMAKRFKPYTRIDSPLLAPQAPPWTLMMSSPRHPAAASSLRQPRLPPCHPAGGREGGDRLLAARRIDRFEVEGGADSRFAIQ